MNAVKALAMRRNRFRRLRAGALCPVCRRLLAQEDSGPPVLVAAARRQATGVTVLRGVPARVLYCPEGHDA